jgi:hypothetical protein
METATNNFSVTVDNDKIVSGIFFITDYGLGEKSEYLNLVVRLTDHGPVDLSQIVDKDILNNNELQIKVAKTLVLEYYNINNKKNPAM